MNYMYINRKSLWNEALEWKAAANQSALASSLEGLPFYVKFKSSLKILSKNNKKKNAI